MATFLDGDAVKNLLEKNKIHKFGSIFEIQKKYDNKKVLKDKNFGHKINVIGETIGEHSEYLVFFETIKKEFEKKGYKLLQTGMFGDTQTIKKYKKMNNAEKGYSTLNRYIIFQKVT